MKTKNIIIATCSIVVVSLVIIALLLFKTPKYEVTFSTDNEVYETIEVKEDGTIDEPTVPTKEGYKFLGWYYNGEKFDFSTKITKNLELVAKWVKEEATIYTIKFDSNGGNKIESIEVEKNKAVGLLPTPKKDGYNFVGWYIGNKEITSTTVAIKDMNLVAKWEKVEKTTKKTVKPVKTTEKVETTTKKTETTEKVTTKPVEETTTKKTTTTKPVVTTKKPTTTKITTTKPVETTTGAQDDVGYDIVKYSDNQNTLYITKNGKVVSGTCDILTDTGETVTNVRIGVDGLTQDDEMISKDTKVYNIKVD